VSTPLVSEPTKADRNGEHNGKNRAACEPKARLWRRSYITRCGPWHRRGQATA